MLEHRCIYEPSKKNRLSELTLQLCIGGHGQEDHSTRSHSMMGETHRGDENRKLARTNSASGKKNQVCVFVSTENQYVRIM